MGGSTPLDVHFVELLMQPVGSAALDDVYGVLGVDGWTSFAAIRSMT